MAQDRFKIMADKILAKIDVRVGGDRPWDLQVHNDAFYRRVLTQGTLGLGESYLDGWWDVQQLDEFFYKFLRSDPGSGVRRNWRTQLTRFAQILLNRQRKSKALEVGERHYDTGNDVFQAMLGKRMVYTCAFWKNANTLDEAQEAKLEFVCQKLGLHPGMKVLDIGCGWGSFAKYAAERYGVSVTGVNNSREQTALAREMCKGLPIEIKVQDYRELTGNYDHIVSLGMFEHVGPKNYETYMKAAHRCLSDDGLFLLHTLGSNKPLLTPDLFVEKYIFPGGVLPTIKEIGGSIEGLFVMEDWQNIGADYEKTLLAWFKNFDAHWPELDAKYEMRFYRMWKYFLHTFAGSSRARSNQVWQIVLSKKGVLGGYVSVR
jgi:cyclopropane-fatty-acyl-phospholipid synthase